MILSMHHFFAFFIILLHLKIHTDYRFNWFLVAIIPLVLGVATLIHPYGTFLRLTADILMFMTVVIYFIKNIRRWHRIQLILDVFVMATIVLGLTSAIFFSKLDGSVLSIQSWINLTTITVTNLFIILMTLVLMSSTSFHMIPKGLSFAILAFGFYVTNNIIDLVNTFSPYTINDSIHVLVQFTAVILLTIGGVISDPVVPLRNDFRRNESPENMKKNRLAMWLSLIPLLLYIVGAINLPHFSIIAVAIIIYLLLSFYVQKTSIMEALLKQDQFLQDKLEALVDDRTMELVKVNEALHQKSRIDDLTGLFNRSYFIAILEQEIQQENNHFSVFFMDLDRFKIINDLHGHDMGDRVLRIVADRFMADVTSNCVFARVGGDEFAVLYKGDNSKDLEDLSQHILRMLEEPIRIDDYQFHVGVSIGIARFPKEALTVKQLLKYADIAMYHAKSEDKSDKFVLYSAQMIEQIERRNYIELLLREANFEKDFELYYQPKFETKTRKLIGMEALIRWNHIDEGAISPAEFIPIAEESGIILGLSEWIFATAMSRIKVINSEYDMNLIMSMNVSPLSLDSVSFLPYLRTLIKKIQVHPSWIELEITEHSAMNNASRMEDLFTAISDLGIRISIDDFGTGYSSLNYIKRFDIDVLKIAKELIDHIEEDLNDRLIVNAIVKMAQGMGLQTIAEGVETQEQYQILEELQCDAIQGYILGRPVPAPIFEEEYL